MHLPENVFCVSDDHCNWCSIQCTQFEMHHTKEVPKIDKTDGQCKAMLTMLSILTMFGDDSYDLWLLSVSRKDSYAHSILTYLHVQ